MRCSVFIPVLGCFFILILTLHSRAEIRVGVAQRDVTPHPLLPVSGGIGPGHPVDSQFGELSVRALVFERDAVRVAFVSADFLGFPSALGNRVRAAVPRIPSVNILIGASHTHSAPDCYGFPGEDGKPGCDLAYLDSVCARMAEAINEAIDTLEPAVLKQATDKAKGQIAFNYYADELYDPRCSVIQALKADQSKILCTLVNYAIHPEVLGSDQGVLSPDLIGPLRDRIESKTNGMAMFINGAQGGMVTADVRGPDGKHRQTREECLRIGELLADEALRIIAPASIQTDPKLMAWAKQVAFPIDSPLMREILKASPLAYQVENEGSIIRTQMNLVELGVAQILTIPGEALPNIGYYLKRQMKGEQNLLFGLTNDAFGYILSKFDWDSFDRYRYITRTSLGEQTGEILVEEALKLVGETMP